MKTNSYVYSSCHHPTHMKMSAIRTTEWAPCQILIGEARGTIGHGELFKKTTVKNCLFQKKIIDTFVVKTDDNRWPCVAKNMLNGACCASSRFALHPQSSKAFCKAASFTRWYSTLTMCTSSQPCTKNKTWHIQSIDNICIHMFTNMLFAP